MSSERKIAANRANGAKSKGPVTPEGKRRSSRNALRHGILAQTVVLDSEDREGFCAFLQELEADLQPQGAVEATLVETFAASRWRQMRIWAFEKVTICDQTAAAQPGGHPVSRAAVAFRTLAENSCVLDLLGRYESRFDRQCARALSQLMRLRALRRPQPEGPAPPPPPPAQPPTDTNPAKRTQEVPCLQSQPPAHVTAVDPTRLLERLLAQPSWRAPLAEAIRWGSGRETSYRIAS